jgi:hypothetical protein
MAANVTKATKATKEQIGAFFQREIVILSG